MRKLSLARPERLTSRVELLTAWESPGPRAEDVDDEDVADNDDDNNDKQGQLDSNNNKISALMRLPKCQWRRKTADRRL